MRIIHIINSLASGGAEKLIEEFVPVMNDRDGVEVEVLLLTDKKNVFDHLLKEKRIKIHVVKLKSIYNPLNILYIKKYIDDGKFDIVHSHLFPTQYWVALSKFFIQNKKVKFVTTEHNTNNRRRGKTYFRFLDKFIYSKYDSIISVSERTQINLVEWLYPDRKQIKKYKVIENGINLEKFIYAIPYKKSELHKEFHESTKLICMVARFDEQKDHPTLIRAISKLSSDVHLLLVGEGHLIERSIELAKELDIADRVHFLGFRNDVERILKTVDVVVLSSHWEGLSLASIEGLASGSPFIASRVQGVQEIVFGYGLLFEKGNAEELCSLIKKLTLDKQFYNEIAEQGLKRAKMYNLNNMVQKLIDLYKEHIKLN